MSQKRFGLVIVIATVALCSAAGTGSGSVSRGAGSSKVVPPKCDATGTWRQLWVEKNGFTVFCGPASAVVWNKGAWHVIRGGVCDGGRLFFGVTSKRGIPHSGLSMYLDSRDEPGTVAIDDGGIELVPGTRAGPLAGIASIEPGLQRGTFSVYVSDGQAGGTEPDSSRFIGAWNCG